MGEELTIIRKPAPVTSPTLRDLLAVLFRQRRLVLLSFIAIFLAALGYGVFAPSYQAHMNVLVRRGRVDPLVTPAPTPSPMFQRDEITEEELNSQVELLRDAEILRTVVQSSGVAGGPWYERFLGGSEEVRLARSVRRLARRLRVEAIRKTNLIQVVYSASDPAHAAAVLHALAHAYLERQQRVRRPSGEYEFFEQQVAQSRRGLLDAEFRLMDFSSDQGVVSAAQERDMVLQVELGTLEAHGQAARVQVAEYREVAQRLGGNALQQGDLLGEMKAAEQKYLLYVNKREEARIENGLDQGGILNVTIAEEPRVPAVHGRLGSSA